MLADMKAKFFLVVFFFTASLTYVALLLYSQISSLSTSNSRMTDNIPLVYGVNVEMSQILPTSKKYVVNKKGEDLIDIAADLGITLFRITNETSAFRDSTIHTYTREEWNMVLDKMHEKGIQALILIESPTLYQKTIPSTYLTLVQEYIIDSDVLFHAAVYGVDLYNEPLANEHNTVMMQTASARIKAKFPKVPLTIGWWAVDTFTKDKDNKPVYKWDDYAAGKLFDDIVDFHSIHMYGFDQKDAFGSYPDPYSLTKRFISNVKNDLQTQKPLLIGEFGAANGETVSDQDTVGSPELQAITYAGVYQAITDLRDRQIIGTVAYQLINREEKPDAWAIVKDNGNYMFPASNVLKMYAKKASDASLTSPSEK